MTKQYNSVREYISSKEYEKYNMRIPISSKANNDISIKQLPYGITILEKDDSISSFEFRNPIISYYNNKIDVTGPRSLLSPDIKNNKKRRHAYNNNVNLWKAFFACNNDIIYTNMNFSVRMNISRPIETFSCIQKRSDVYFPLAFLENGIVIGGAFINLWKCGTFWNCGTKHASYLSQHLPISIFHTAACMFGSMLYGVDAQLQKHSLTDPNYKLPSDSIIVDIENDVETHPDEILFCKSLINLIPLMKTLAKNGAPVIKHQIPLANYILYGINKYLNHGMSRKSLEKYVKKVKARAKEHECNLNNIAKEHGITIEFYSSLKHLNLDVFPEETIVENLFEQIKFKYQFSKIDNKNIMQSIFMSIIDYLSGLNNDTGEIWKMVKNKINDNTAAIDTHNLLEINYLDYSVTLALIKSDEAGKEICSIMPSHEKHIAIRYKNLFSEKLGHIFCMSYLPSMHICIEEYKNAMFYLDNHIHEVNALLNEGIITLSSLQTASIALDSVALSKQASEQMWQLLSRHRCQDFC